MLIKQSFWLQIYITNKGTSSLWFLLHLFNGLLKVLLNQSLLIYDLTQESSKNLHIIYYYLKYHVVNCSSSISSNFLVSLSSSGTRERTDPVPVLPLRTDANRLFLMLYLLFLLKSSTCFLFSRLKKPHCWKKYEPLYSLHCFPIFLTEIFESIMVECYDTQDLSNNFVYSYQLHDFIQSLICIIKCINFYDL